MTVATFTRVDGKLPGVLPDVDVIVVSFEDVIDQHQRAKRKDKRMKKRKQESVFEECKWMRVVIDEFHKSIKATEHGARGLFAAIQALDRVSTVIVSGTPLLGGHLHASGKTLMALLKFYPFCRLEQHGNVHISNPYNTCIETPIEEDGDMDAATLLADILKELMFRDPESLEKRLGVGVGPCIHQKHLAEPCNSEKYVLKTTAKIIEEKIVGPVNSSKTCSLARKCMELKVGCDILRKQLSNQRLVEPKRFEMSTKRDFEEPLASKESLADQTEYFVDVENAKRYEAEITPAEFDTNKLDGKEHASFKACMKVYSSWDTYVHIHNGIDDGDPSAATIDASNVSPEMADMFKDLECIICTKIPVTPVMTTKCGHLYCTSCYEKNYAECMRKLPKRDCPKGSSKCPKCNTITSAHPLRTPSMPDSEDEDEDVPEIVDNVLIKVTDGQDPYVNYTTNSWEVGGINAVKGATTTSTVVEFADTKTTMVQSEKDLGSTQRANAIKAYYVEANGTKKKLTIETSVLVDSRTGNGKILKVTIPELDRITALKIALAKPNSSVFAEAKSKAAKGGGFAITNHGAIMRCKGGGFEEENSVEFDIISPKKQKDLKFLESATVGEFIRVTRESGDARDWFHVTPNRTTVKGGESLLYFVKNLTVLKKWNTQFEKEFSEEDIPCAEFLLGTVKASTKEQPNPEWPMVVIERSTLPYNPATSVSSATGGGGLQ